MEEFNLIPDESVFFDFTPEEVSLVFYLWGLLVTPSLTIDELNVLGNGLFLLAQVLFTIATQRTLLNDSVKAQKETFKQPKEDGKSVENLELEIKKLQEQIEKMQKKIEKFEK